MRKVEKPARSRKPIAIDVTTVKGYRQRSGSTHWTARAMWWSGTKTVVTGYVSWTGTADLEVCNGQDRNPAARITMKDGALEYWGNPAGHIAYHMPDPTDENERAVYLARLTAAYATFPQVPAGHDGWYVS